MGNQDGSFQRTSANHVPSPSQPIEDLTEWISGETAQNRKKLKGKLSFKQIERWYQENLQKIKAEGGDVSENIEQLWIQRNIYIKRIDPSIEIKIPEENRLANFGESREKEGNSPLMQKLVNQKFDKRESRPEGDLYDFGYNPTTSIEYNEKNSITVSNADSLTKLLNPANNLLKPNTTIKLKDTQEGYSGSFDCKIKNIKIVPENLNSPPRFKNGSPYSLIFQEGGCSAEHLNFDGGEMGVRLNKSNNSILNCEFKNHKHLSIDCKANDSLIEGCDISHFHKDGIFIQGHNVTIDTCNLHDYLGTDDAHNDGIQIAAAVFGGDSRLYNGKEKIKNLRIVGCTIDMGNGHTEGKGKDLQGIFAGQVMLEDAFISDNNITVDSDHGITGAFLGNSVIEGNVLRKGGGRGKIPKINILASRAAGQVSTPIDVDGNADTPIKDGYNVFVGKNEWEDCGEEGDMFYNIWNHHVIEIDYGDKEPKKLEQKEKKGMPEWNNYTAITFDDGPVFRSDHGDDIRILKTATDSGIQNIEFYWIGSRLFSDDTLNRFDIDKNNFSISNKNMKSFLGEYKTLKKETLFHPDALKFAKEFKDNLPSGKTLSDVIHFHALFNNDQLDEGHISNLSESEQKNHIKIFEDIIRTLFEDKSYSVKKGKSPGGVVSNKLSKEIEWVGLGESSGDWDVNSPYNEQVFAQKVLNKRPSHLTMHSWTYGQKDSQMPFSKLQNLYDILGRTFENEDLEEGKTFAAGKNSLFKYLKNKNLTSPESQEAAYYWADSFFEGEFHEVSVSENRIEYNTPEGLPLFISKNTIELHAQIKDGIFGNFTKEQVVSLGENIDSGNLDAIISFYNRECKLHDGTPKYSNFSIRNGMLHFDHVGLDGKVVYETLEIKADRAILKMMPGELHQ